MRISRAFLHPRPLVASLLLAASLLSATGLLQAGAEARASGAVRAPSPPESAGDNATHLSHGRFRDFLVYKPSGPPTSFVLLLSGDEGWNSTADAMARQLVQQGAMVASIDWAKLKANL